MSFLSDIKKRIESDKTSREVLCTEIDNVIKSADFDTDAKEYVTPERVSSIKENLSQVSERAKELSLNFFVSKKPLKKRVKETKILLSELDIRVSNYNALAIRDLVGEAKNLIGNVEGKTLDEQQMACIVKPAKNHLVVAGAGTGKTTTIVGKIKYLLKSGKCKPEDILVLSFTHASAEEMSGRINQETGESIEASTFHKLGLNIITKAKGITPKISKIVLQKFVREQLQKNMDDQKYLWLLCKYFLYNHKYYKSEFDFQNQSEYDEYLKLNQPVTLKGEVVKSYGEMDIANFLYENGIRYEYEKEYEIDTRTAEKAMYYPDFYLPDYRIYIEYFGINEAGEVPSYYSAKDGKNASQLYRESMEWKRKTHKKHGTKLIECFSYERTKGELLSNLEKNLKEAGVEFKPISSNDLWNKIAETNDKDVLVGVSDLMSTIISLVKSNDISFTEVRKMIQDNKRVFYLSGTISIVEPIYNAYQDALKKNDEIDFNDMINFASELVRQGKYVNPYKFVIVDEYQDISKSRYNLLKTLRGSADYELFCVGDDWQSIYRFTGSDMDYILNFEKYWGPTELSKIETTYRFTDSLIGISSDFVMQNPAQIRKNIRGVPSTLGFALGEIKGYTEDTAIQFMLSRIEELPQESSVFFIGRYTFDSRMLSECKDLDCCYDNATGEAKVVYPKRKDLKMQFITAHKSKGLQADYVFIINNKNRGMGFPSKIQDDPMVDLLLEGKEDFPFAEERRLYYVALTRAKKKSYMVVINGNESTFISEMNYRYADELKKEAFTCPICGGKLEKKKGPYGEFFACSNYKITGCSFKRKLSKKN